ncbi:MAG: HPF/RaiA family ribosome-associated protein [Rickettsiales bacterium]|jgi:ribosomal subunit interface protein|nr:HPF/RaiA family ribosome-associated protein [Rickettsiales bacterium]
MKINLNSDFDLGETFAKYANGETESCIGKYLGDAVSVDILVDKKAKIFKIDMVVNDGQKRGVLIAANAKSNDIYRSLDMALKKVAGQIKKYKSKLLDYRKRRGALKIQNMDIPYIPAQKTVLKEKVAGGRSDNGDGITLDVVIEKEIDIEELSLDEAIMKMGLAGLPAYMFINKDNERMNVVYRRTDGNLSWLNPKK